MKYQQILYEVSDQVATVTLNRPEALNAWTDVMADEVWQAMHEAERDDAVRVIVLTGAGRAFCAGGDVTGFKGQDDGDFPRSLLTKLPRTYDFSRRPDYQSRAAYFPAIDRPIIAMLNGATAGLGLVHALFADIRIAADDAVITTAFARIGLASEYGMAWALRNVVGPAAAADLLLSARKVRGEEVLRLGLASQLHPRERLADATLRLCARARHGLLAPVAAGDEAAALEPAVPEPARGLDQRQRGDAARQPQRRLPGRQARLQGKAPTPLHRTLSMDLRPTPEEDAFRREVREFVAARLPDDIRRKVLGFLRVEREDYVRWQRILAERGWGAPGWPVAYGGCGWNAVRRNIFEEECFVAGAPRQMPFGLSMIAPVLMKFGTPAAAAALPAAHPDDGRLVVPGLLGAGRRLGPRLAEDARRAPRRPLRRHRAEDLDLVRAVGELDVRARAHGHRRQAAAGHLAAADPHGQPRHHGAPDQDAGRRLRRQRGLPRGRGGSARWPGRRAGRRLDHRQVPARPRAHRDRGAGHVQAAAAPAEGGRARADEARPCR